MRKTHMLLGGVIAATLATGTFLAHGAHAVRPVTVASAVASFRDDPRATPLDGWDRPADTPKPAPGVYAYRTTGGARVDTFDIDRRYPEVTARVVRHGPGCQWVETVPIFAEHTETYAACATGGDQADAGFGTRLTYFFVPGVTDLSCDAGGTRTGWGARVGTAARYRCADPAHGVTADAEAVFEGERAVRVDGVVVTCRQVTIRTVLRGTTSGGAVRELCTLPDTGLVVTERRAVGVVVDSPFVGRVVYTEQATFTLLSLTPRS